ncbi:MAG TPA: energy transducer TonB [Thermoanaerobaculia bacterium]|nr:energy transducer TonB [Thermoanaerobaculia bacterium]
MVARKEPYVPQELQGVASDVTLELLVDRNGVVLGSRRTAGDPRFYPAAATAAQQWRFEPLLVNGEPVAFALPVRFVLTWPASRRGDIHMSYVIPE